MRVADRPQRHKSRLGLRHSLRHQTILRRRNMQYRPIGLDDQQVIAWLESGSHLVWHPGELVATVGQRHAGRQRCECLDGSGGSLGASSIHQQGLLWQ